MPIRVSTSGTMRSGNEVITPHVEIKHVERVPAARFHIRRKPLCLRAYQSLSLISKAILQIKAKMAMASGTGSYPQRDMAKPLRVYRIGGNEIGWTGFLKVRPTEVGLTSPDLASDRARP